MEAQGKRKKKKKPKEEEKDQRKRKRVATANRRERRRMKKTFDFRRPSLNVFSNAFPNPDRVSLKEYLIAEQLVRLQKRTDSEEWKQIGQLQEEFNEELQKKKPNLNKEKELRSKLNAFFKSVQQTLERQKNSNSQCWIQKQEQLVDQWKRMQKKEVISEEEEIREERVNCQGMEQKKLIIGFGAAKFPSHGIAREEIKSFLKKNTKVKVYNVNEFYTSKKCCVCGKVRRKRIKSELYFFVWCSLTQFLKKTK